MQSGFAQLAGSHPLLLQMVANNGLPAAVLAPSNTALETLLQKQQQDASTLTNYTDGPKNSSWQQFVANAQKAPAESILLLLRHGESSCAVLHRMHAASQRCKKSEHKIAPHNSVEAKYQHETAAQLVIRCDTSSISTSGLPLQQLCRTSPHGQRASDLPSTTVALTVQFFFCFCCCCCYSHPCASATAA